jgi:hypothetical protein
MYSLLLYRKSEIARRTKSDGEVKHLRDGENTPVERAAFARALVRKLKFLPKFA